MSQKFVAIKAIYAIAMLVFVVFRLVVVFRIVRGLDSNILHNDYSRPGSVKYLQEPLVQITDTTGPARKLVEFTKSEYLTKEVVKVTTDVYVAIGYALANSIMVVGKCVNHWNRLNQECQNYLFCIYIIRVHLLL